MTNRTTAFAVIVFAICVASAASAFAHKAQHQQRTHEHRSYLIMVTMNAPSYDVESIGNFPYP